MLIQVYNLGLARADRERGADFHGQRGVLGRVFMVGVLELRAVGVAGEEQRRAAALALPGRGGGARSRVEEARRGRGEERGARGARGGAGARRGARDP
eukprot:2260717-Rhodomonas_salina.1